MPTDRSSMKEKISRIKDDTFITLSTILIQTGASAVEKKKMVNAVNELLQQERARIMEAYKETTATMVTLQAITPSYKPYKNQQQAINTATEDCLEALKKNLEVQEKFFRATVLAGKRQDVTTILQDVTKKVSDITKKHDLIKERLEANTQSSFPQKETAHEYLMWSSTLAFLITAALTAVAFVFFPPAVIPVGTVCAACLLSSAYHYRELHRYRDINNTYFPDVQKSKEVKTLSHAIQKAMHNNPPHKRQSPGLDQHSVKKPSERPHDFTRAKLRSSLKKAQPGKPYTSKTKDVEVTLQDPHTTNTRPKG